MSCGGCNEGKAQALRKSFSRLVSSHSTNLCNMPFHPTPPLIGSRPCKSKWSAGHTLHGYLTDSSSLANGREKRHKWGLAVMPKLPRNSSCMSTPRRKKIPGCPGDNLGAGQKIQICRSSQSTRLTQISALGLMPSKRQPPAQQSAFCAARHCPPRDGWKKFNPLHL